MAELGESRDPKDLLSGDAKAVAATAHLLTRFGQTLSRVGSGLRDLDHGGWKGKAADAFHDFYDAEPKRWITCGDAFHDAARALTSYSNTLAWAQEQADQAISLWEHGEQQTRQAKAAYERSAQQAQQQGGVDGASALAPFSDPGEATRERARSLLHQARSQVQADGSHSARVVAKAQEAAPPEPSLWDKAASAVESGLHSLADDVRHGAATALRGVGHAEHMALQGAGKLLGAEIKGAGKIAGGALHAGASVLSGLGFRDGSRDLETAGEDVETSTEDAGEDVEDHTDDAGQDIEDTADREATDVEDGGSGSGGGGGGRDPGGRGHYVIIDKVKYPETAQHVEEAQSGISWRGDERREQQQPSDLTIDRDGASANRKQSLHGIPTRGAEKLDRDEYPPAMFEEGGLGASVKYIDRSDNRGAGSSMKGQLTGLDNGEHVTVVTG
ncbi:putative T7SS-secreted protein [Streptomyces sp. WAC01526]|uniref:putative T7SS-secreted protein n=1 Tax=Streptomyces sp. WAC01526 TaxID=2588709 RepID=UPI001CA35B1B|nr:NucA/NucB deoxyribonuclease domain-containing protein [Streptomyces sp. WAC01526]